MFLAKFALADGEAEFVKGFKGMGAPKISAMAMNGTYVALTGHLDDTLDFGKGELGAGAPDERFFLAILDKQGALLRSTAAGEDGPGERRGLGVTLDATDAYVAGHFEGTMSIAGQTRTSMGNTDMFVARLCLP